MLTNEGIDTKRNPAAYTYSHILGYGMYNQGRTAICTQHSSALPIKVMVCQTYQDIKQYLIYAATTVVKRELFPVKQVFSYNSYGRQYLNNRTRSPSLIINVPSTIYLHYPSHQSQPQPIAIYIPLMNYNRNRPFSTEHWQAICIFSSMVSYIQDNIANTAPISFYKGIRSDRENLSDVTL